MSLPLPVRYSEKSSDSKDSDPDPIKELPLELVNTYQVVNDDQQVAFEKRTMYVHSKYCLVYIMMLTLMSV